jgi:subtilase family serine protease
MKARINSQRLALVALGLVLSTAAHARDTFITVRDDMSGVLARTRYLSHADPGQVLHLNISLRSPNSGALAAFVDDVSNPSSPHYRWFLSPENLGDMFGQPRSAVREVQTYLESQGFSVKLVGKSRLNIMADATVAEVERAFNTTINRYATIDPRDSGRAAFYANAAPIQAPSSFASRILTVTGLQNYSQPKASMLTINQAHTLYGVAKEFAGGMYGQGRNVAYSNFDGFRTSNLALYYSAYSLPTPPGGVGSNVTIIPVDGGAGSGTANGEGDLDMQMILGMAPVCNLLIYDGSQSETDVLTKEQDDNIADVISESYGWGYPPADEDANHQIHLLMSAQGITYMCAAGDGGTTYLNADEAAYPDIDPDVLTIGGTIATTDATGNRLSEVVWPNGGGGYSSDGAACNALPSYQKLGTTGIPTGIPYRLLPDVSVNGGGQGQQGAAFPFYWNGQLITYGQGTSFSSPLFAGGLGVAEQKLIALGKLPADAHGNRRFGRINDLFYSQELRPDVWYDIVSGSNGTLLNGQPSNATKGWDTASGLGAINFDGFVASLAGVGVKVAVSPTAVEAGAKVTGEVTLSGPAGAGGDVVALTSSDPSYVGVPSSVTVPAGGTSASFSITTRRYSADYASTIGASFGTASASAGLTVYVDGVSGVTLKSTAFVGGTSTVGTVTLLANAPSGGWKVKLASSEPSYLGVPASLIVPEGTKTATFAVTSKPSKEKISATVTASDPISAKGVLVTLLGDSVKSLSLTPSSVVGGASSTGTVTLTSAAPEGGWTVKIANSSADVAAPAAVTVPAGSTSAKFTLRTKAVKTTVTASVGASDALTKVAATLTIKP